MMTHQELFDRWYSAERNVIGEWSTDYRRDSAVLWSEAAAYADTHGLTFTEPYEEWWKEDDK